MKSVEDIMVRDVIAIKDTESVHQARMLLKEYKIRHLPVVSSESSEFLGMLTQASLLNHAFKLIEKFGISGLQKREQRTQVREIMQVDVIRVSPADSLLDVCELFTSKQASCVPVIEGGQLKGIVTSVDFVKLALRLLKSA